MADINASIIPLIEPIANIVDTVKLLVGGVFGLYLILAIFKVKEYFYVKKQLKALRAEIKELNEKVETLTKKTTKSTKPKRKKK